jgi:hypothetical protein
VGGARVLTETGAAPFAPTEMSGGQPVAWVTQGAVLYLRGSLGPVWPQLVDVWERLLAARRGEPWRYYRVWSDMRWRALDSAGLRALRELLARGESRPFWKVEVANREATPDLSIEFADVRPTAGEERASYVRIRRPLDGAPDELRDSVLQLADALPFWVGSAGHLFNPVEAAWLPAFDQIWAWARRYWGVEVVDLRAGTWDALRGLTSVNWLTLLGDQFLEANASVNPGAASGALAARRTRHGVVLQAGARPVLGDINSFEEIAPYREAARLLEPALLADPTPFAGMFTDHESTLAWGRRFLEPEPWMDPDLI